MAQQEVFRARRMVEAFRLGIVPSDCTDDWIFGRETEIKRLLAWLRNEAEPSLLLVGAYGSGKTHLVHYTFWRALRQGYAAAYVEMDPNESPFHRPKRVYSRIVYSFRFPIKGSQQPGRFRDFLAGALSQGLLRDHACFRHLRSYALSSAERELLWEWIEGAESAARPSEGASPGTSSGSWTSLGFPPVPALYDHQTAANIYCYLLSGLGAAAIQAFGLRGLVVLFDEAETLWSGSGYQSARASNFFSALVETAKDNPRLLLDPEAAGYTYARNAPSIPFLYQAHSGLKLLFAFTEVQASMPQLHLDRLSDAALESMFDNIGRLYEQAYGFRASQADVERARRLVTRHSGRTRLFVKGCVEALDLLRCNAAALAR
ncbi:MAG: DUF2791 family P-loop domain-containing protein [Chloroflexi bacterium]|nr:DUF2791 family P-loop domain-containing protein [Chloroflexota bacterium]